MKAHLSVLFTRVSLASCLWITALSAQAALTDSWNFNESSGNIASNSVSANNGTVLGGVTHVAGQVDKAYQFDGNNGYVTFGNNVGNFGTGDFSISVWMRNSGNAGRAFLEKRPACNMDYGVSWWDIRMSDTIGIAIASDHNQYYTDIVTAKPVNDGLWHHVVWERAGSTLKVFLDGALSGSKNIPGTINLSNSVAMRAAISSCDYIDGTYPYPGALDELQLFNHALTAEEVKSMYETVIANLPPDCATSLALAQAQLAGANQTNALLTAQLQAASTSVSNLQQQLTTLNQSYNLLQSQYNSANNWNTYYVDLLTKIAQPVSQLSSNYAIQYNSPGFKIPGATLDLQVSNIVFGIQTLDSGAQSKLFKLWSQKKTTSGF